MSDAPTAFDVIEAPVKSGRFHYSRELVDQADAALRSGDGVPSLIVTEPKGKKTLKETAQYDGAYLRYDLARLFKQTDGERGFPQEFTTCFAEKLEEDADGEATVYRWAVVLNDRHAASLLVVEESEDEADES